MYVNILYLVFTDGLFLQYFIMNTDIIPLSCNPLEMIELHLMVVVSQKTFCILRTAAALHAFRRLRITVQGTGAFVLASVWICREMIGVLRVEMLEKRAENKMLFNNEENSWMCA